MANGEGIKGRESVLAAARRKLEEQRLARESNNAPQTDAPESVDTLQPRDQEPDPNSIRSQQKAALSNAIAAALGKSQGPNISTADDSATLDAAMRNTAERARFGKELVEACARLKEKIDAQVVTLMNIMNKALDIGTDGRAYTLDAASDSIVANTISPDLISSFRATEGVTRELKAIVTDMPGEIEKLFEILDESHGEFISIITGEKTTVQKRSFTQTPEINPLPSRTIPARSTKSIEASLQAALGESANRAEFLQLLVEASKRLKEKIDIRVISLLTMMNNALTNGVDNAAYTFDAVNNRMMPVPQADLIVGFTTTENAARELEVAVTEMPREIQALITELLQADEEFNELIAQGLARGSN